MVRARHEAMAAPLDLAKRPNVETPRLDESEAPGALCEVRLRKGDFGVGQIGAVLTLGAPQDVTLQEPRVELFTPADDASMAALAALGDHDA
jgi:hypothetical protein